MNCEHWTLLHVLCVRVSVSTIRPVASSATTAIYYGCNDFETETKPTIQTSTVLSHGPVFWNHDFPTATSSLFTFTFKRKKNFSLKLKVCQTFDLIEHRFFFTSYKYWGLNWTLLLATVATKFIVSEWTNLSTLSTIHVLVYELSKSSEKHPWKLPTAQDNIFKFIFLCLTNLLS